MFRALDFFAGSGLVRLGLQSEFETVWANDNCPKKRAVYEENYPNDSFCPLDIQEVSGADLPSADLAWASFPCQDLSLAGNLHGIKSGTRSGLFWEWVRILDELEEKGRRPPVLVAENVIGFLVAHESQHFRLAYEALRKRGYWLGAVVIDAELFVPQSRPRAFIIAVTEGTNLRGFTQRLPSAGFHPSAVTKAAFLVGDDDWVWWSLPMPSGRTSLISDLCKARESNPFEHVSGWNRLPAHEAE
jgi:DNA (cytosine-5)-methyltransferase 1